MPLSAFAAPGPSSAPADPLADGYRAWWMNAAGDGSAFVVDIGGDVDGASTTLGTFFALWMVGDRDRTLASEAHVIAHGAVRAHATASSTGQALGVQRSVECDISARFAELLGTPGCFSRVSFRAVPSEPGMWVLVAILGTDGDWSGTVRVGADPGIEVVAETGGPALFALRSDFDATAAAGLETPGFIAAGTVSGGVRKVAAQDSLAGSYLGSTCSDLLEMGYAGPGVAASGRHWYHIVEGPPGGWSFTLETPVDGCSDNGVWLLIADIAGP